MKHSIPPKLYVVFNQYISDDEITEWLNDCVSYDTWDIDYDAMTLEITGAQQPYNIQAFWSEVEDLFETELEDAE